MSYVNHMEKNTLRLVDSAQPGFKEFQYLVPENKPCTSRVYNGHQMTEFKCSPKWFNIWVSETTVDRNGKSRTRDVSVTMSAEHAKVIAQMILGMVGPIKG